MFVFFLGGGGGGGGGGVDLPIVCDGTIMEPSKRGEGLPCQIVRGRFNAIPRLVFRLVFPLFNRLHRGLESRRCTY